MRIKGAPSGLKGFVMQWIDFVCLFGKYFLSTSADHKKNWTKPQQQCCLRIVVGFSAVSQFSDYTKSLPGEPGFQTEAGCGKFVTVKVFRSHIMKILSV